MITQAIRDNLSQMKKCLKELYIFTNQLEIINRIEATQTSVINQKEKKLLKEGIESLTNQFRILNESLPLLLDKISFHKRLPTENTKISFEKKDENLIQIKYKPQDKEEKISLTIENKYKDIFLENLAKSNISSSKLKDKFLIKTTPTEIIKPNVYIKISNYFFRELSNKLVAKGYFDKLNNDLRKMSSPYVIGSYVSMILFSVFITFLFSFFLFIFLLFYNISLDFPFISIASETILQRILKYFWIIFAVPISTGFLLYVYPSSEAKSIGSKINQELPFVTIHMSAIASSGIDPTGIFSIITQNDDYPYTNKEFKKILNLVNFHGKDIVTALRIASNSCPSSKLKELMNGLATTITSGGSLSQFLDKHAESLLFDYRLEREKYTKISETFMDIYISVIIAAPMILLMLFVIMGSTGALSNFLGLSADVVGMLIVLIISLLNIGFLFFLKIQQPSL